MRRGRHAVVPTLLVSAAALAATSCGGDESALDAALGYMPEDAPFVAAVSTDLDSDQWQALDDVAERFPFRDQVVEGLKEGIEAEGVDFEGDVRPLLGNDFVVGAPSVEALMSDDGEALGAIQADDGDELRDLVEEQSDEIGEASDATLFRAEDETFLAIEEDVLVVASSEERLREALERKDGDDGLSEDRFEEALDGLPEDALVRVFSDIQAVLESSPEAEPARRVPWVAALRTLGATVAVERDAIGAELALETDAGELSADQLPIAAGAESPPVVAREGEIGVGVRDPAQIFRFAESVAQAVDPEGFRDFQTAKRQIGERLDIDVDEELIGQFEGAASISFDVEGGFFGLRSELADPDRFQRTLERLADELPELAESFGMENLAVDREGDFFAVADPGGDALVFGVVNRVFVLAHEAERAAELASQQPEPVEGAEGSVVLRANAEQVANRALERLDGASALGASLFTGPLGELLGSLRADGDGLRGSLSLEIE